GQRVARPRRRDQPRRRGRLQRRELEPRARIAGDDELHGAVTEIADAVKQNHGRQLASWGLGDVVSWSLRDSLRGIHDRFTDSLITHSAIAQLPNYTEESLCPSFSFFVF